VSLRCRPQGAALLAVLFLLLLVSVLLLAAYGWVAQTSELMTRSTAREVAFQRAQNALVFAASEFAAAADDRRSAIESLETPFGAVDSRLLGAWLWLRTRQALGIDTVTLTAMAGIRHDPSEPFVFQALDTRFPLVVADEGRIDGSVRVGRSGCKSDQWQGREYRFRVPTHGSIDTTTPTPATWGVDPSEWFRKLRELRVDPPLAPPDAEFAEGAVTLRSSGTFPPRPAWSASKLRAAEPVTIRVRGDLESIGSLLIEGPIEWIVEGNLTISDSTRIRGSAFWVEGTTTIAGGAEFAGQLLTTGQVSVREQAQVFAPSLVWCHRIIGTTADRSLRVEGSARIEGTLIQTVEFIPGEAPRTVGDVGVEMHSSEPQLVSAYLESYVLLYGKLSGEVYGKGFWFYEQPTTYINWLVRGQLTYNPKVTTFAWPFMPSRIGTPVFMYAEEPATYAL
jgi:cytoskeletal protein CcmA (bactofilin family)